MFDIQELSREFTVLSVEEDFFIKCQSMNHEVHQFEDDVHRISLLRCYGLKGALCREMLVVSTLHRNSPLLVMQYSAFLFKHLLQVDILEIDKNHHNKWSFAALENILQNKNLKKNNFPDEWYYPMRLPASANVSGHKKVIEKVAKDVLWSFLKLSKQSGETRELHIKRELLNHFINDIFEHGCFGYDALRVCFGKETAERLFQRLFLPSDAS